MTSITAGIIIAIIALIGSATVAAIISTRWQRNQYEADVLHAAFKSVMEAHARLNGDVLLVSNILATAVDSGQIWESQRVEMKAGLVAAQQHAVELASRINVCAGVMEDPDVTQILDDLVESAREVTRALGIIQGWNPTTIPDRVAIRIREGLDHRGALEAIHAATRAFVEQNKRFIRIARVKWRELLDILPR